MLAMQLLTLLYMTIFGIMTIAITPNEQVPSFLPLIEEGR